MFPALHEGDDVGLGTGLMVGFSVGFAVGDVVGLDDVGTSVGEVLTHVVDSV